MNNNLKQLWLTLAICHFLLLPFAVSAEAATINAASCSAANVQTAINSASNGDTVVVPAGTCNWSSKVSISDGITLQGQSVCTGSGNPNGGTSGVVSCTDNTIITLSIDQVLSVSPSAGQVATVTGFTFIENFTSNHGVINLGAPHAQVGFRFHHNHVQMPVSNSVAVTGGGGYGVIDHNYFQDTVTSGIGGVPLVIYGDFATNGYLDWKDPTQFGSDQAVYVEDNYYTTTHTNTEGFFDAYYGAKEVVRYNTVIGNEIGGWHGTDTGFPFRSGVYGEIYGNSITNAPGTFGIMNTRGGTVLFWGNTLLGTNTGGVILQYYRYGEQNPNANPWGSAGAGLNWLIPNANNPSNWTPFTLNAADFTASHAYAALAVVGPLSQNSGAFNFQLTNGPCTSGASPASWAQSWGATTTDSNGCVWKNVGGKTAASSFAAGITGWCAANPDTLCSSNATCAALQAGDTCSRYFDSNGGVYPFRDQSGRVHNQVLAPNYEWGNAGSALPNPVLRTDAETTGIVVANRDYFNHAASFNGTSGTGSGLLSARPASCALNVAYWATDTNTLYQCSSPNTWTIYYTPYVYPHPLAGGSAPSSSPCDINNDNVANVIDVQLEVNMALQISPCTNPSGQCTVVQVQRVVNAALGGACVSPL